MPHGAITSHLGDIYFKKLSITNKEGVTTESTAQPLTVNWGPKTTNIMHEGRGTNRGKGVGEYIMSPS